MENFSQKQIDEFRLAFDHFDEDNSGDLSMFEIMAVFRSQGVRMTEKEVADLIAEIDTDGNGTIDFPEFLEAMAATKQDMRQINRFKKSVQIVMKLEREIMPVFLPRSEDDPDFKMAELNRQGTMKRLMKDKEIKERETDYRRTASKAALVESKSRREMSRASKSRKDLTRKPEPATKSTSRGILSRLTKRDSKSKIQVNAPKARPRYRGSETSATMLDSVLNGTPITEDNADEDENVFTYQAFDDRHTKLYSPLVGKILAETPHLFCLKVSDNTDNLAVYDEDFQSIKVLGVSEQHAEKGLLCYYAIVTIPSRCRKVLVACRSGTTKNNVTYDVFLHYDVQSVVEFRALQTTLEAALEDMMSARDMKDYFGTVEAAESVLYYDPEHWEALTILSEALIKLGEYRKAVKAIDTIIRLDAGSLPADSPHRLRAYEIKAKCERLRGFVDQCAEQCKLGLKLFGSSRVLEEELALATAEMANDKSPARWNAADKRAMSCPEAAATSVAELARYLAEPFTKEVEKARCFFRWIASHIGYDAEHLQSGTYTQTDLSAEGCLQSRKAVCQGYCNLFKAMCESEGIECVTIRGFARTDLQSVETMNIPNHVWNAFNVDGKWYLADVTWACGTLRSDFTFNTEFNGVFWMTHAEFFLNSHFPEDPNWQLVPVDISKEEFCALVPLTSHMMQTGLELVSHKRVEIKAPIGERTVIELQETKPDHVFLAIEIINLQTLDVVPWPAEARYDRTTHSHDIVFAPMERGVFELVVFYSYEETGTFNSLFTYKIVAH